MKILIAEDSPILAALLRDCLVSAGHTVGMAANGQEALDYPDLPAIDLILMDVQMPVLDGLSASRQLRERGFTAPILACTGIADPEIEKRIKAAGCSLYVPKPMDFAALLSTLTEIQDRRFLS